MAKNIFFFVFLLSTSFFFQNISALDLNCKINYYNIPAPPVCGTIVENGEEEEVCTSIGSAAFAETLNKENSSLSQDFFEVYHIEFRGYCNCGLRVYTRTNLKGCYVEERVFTYELDQIFVDQIWKKAGHPQSFSVVCKF